MFNDLKKRIKYLEELTTSLDERLEKLSSDESYKVWREMSEANKEEASKQGYFYLNNKCDTILLEKVISEINKNEDLTALFRTADGTTLSLRVHPHLERREKGMLQKFNVVGVE